MTNTIYHITHRADWEAAQTIGDYRAESLASQGFIHASKADQVAKVANAIYVGESDLVLLVITIYKLAAPLKYEPPDTTIPAEHEDAELFPHIYGALNLDSVIEVLDFAPGEDGRFVFPTNNRQ